jgi:hypothetical protein
VEAFSLIQIRECRSFVGNVVRLEVGTAHRCGVDETIGANNHSPIIYRVRFTRVAPVGDAHL